MSLPKHLHAATYWEKRCELLEESVQRIMQILANTALPQHAVSALIEHNREWNGLIRKLGDEHPAPPENT